MVSWWRMPGARPVAILLVALSLSIGWGIRGDFGHESGAMLPGALAALAACLLSGRPDWRAKAPYFAVFGGMGFAFGGSIAYMYCLSFAGSEHWPTAIYGFFCTFITGALWAGMGGAGTALPAVMDRGRLEKFFVPLCFTLAVFTVNLNLGEYVSEWIKSSAADPTWNRQRSPLYWYDADWLSAVAALAGICLFDLWDRRFAKAHLLALLAAAGAAAGWAVQAALNALGAAPKIAALLVVRLGDPAAINPETGTPFDPSEFLTNWPNFVHYYPQHVGWGVGLVLGIAAYFWRYGTWRRDAGLILYMSLGWLLAFLIMPVLGTIPLQPWGGFRLMPPRSDDWAGIVGVFVGMTVYCLRFGLKPVAFAGSLTAILGGVGFALVPFVRSIVRLPGNAQLTPGGTPPEWAHYHSANWHSILEQSHGFCHGLAIAVTMAVLAAWVKRDTTPRTRRWTGVASVFFVLFVLTLLNVYKNVPEWTEGGHKVVPAVMKAPLINVALPAMGWFALAWGAVSLAALLLMLRHERRPVEFVPASPVGRGQLLYIALMWMMVIADFERALPNFSEGRLVTEWVIFMNAALATLLIGMLPGPDISVPDVDGPAPSLRRLWLRAAPIVAALMVAFAVLTRMMYGAMPVESKSSNHDRFGQNAHWRIAPILKTGKHR